MGRPAKSVVYKANVDALFGLAAPTRTVGSKVMDAANAVHGTIIGLDWEGVAKNGAVGRADRELAQDKRVVLGYNALADAYHNGSVTMAPMIADLTKAGQGLEADTFDVSEDWVVTDKFDYQAGRTAMQLMGFTREEANDKMNQVQAQRGEEAKTATVKLQRQADDLGHADQDTANDITKATGDIKDAAPPLAGLSGGDLGSNDIADVMAGKGTPEEKARVQAAMSSWTPDQLAALQQGKPATMPQGQYDYLKSLMHGMDGMSATDINKTMKDMGLQGAMGDTMRMMGNPNMQTANGDRGSLNNEPKKIQDLLKNDPVQWIEGRPDKLGGTIRVPLSQFNAMDEMLNSGNKNLQLGSDVDRAMLNQASRIAHTVENDGHWRIGVTEKGYDDVVPFKNVANTLDGMLNTGSGDHQAVADFLHGGPAMDAVAGGHFDNRDAFRTLATFSFDKDQHGFENLFGWMGDGAYKPGYEGHIAAVAADSTAHLLSTNSDLAAHIPDGHGGYQGLGQMHPGLVQTMTKNLIPFLGNLDGVGVPGIQGDAIHGFTDTKDLANMIQVLDSDPASAEAINRGAAAWNQHFAYEYGLTGKDEVAYHAGSLAHAVRDANEAELTAFKDNHSWDTLRAYQDKSKTWDTTKEILNDAAGYIPGGGAAMSLSKDLANLAAGDLKDSVLGIAGDPVQAAQDTTTWQKALDATNTNFGNLVDGHLHDFNLTQGYIDSHHDVQSQFQNAYDNGEKVNFFGPDGRLDWKVVSAHEDTFDKLIDGLNFKGGWNDPDHGYPGGMKYPNMNPITLPDPGNASQAPK